MIRCKYNIPIYGFTLYLIKISFEDYKREDFSAKSMGLRSESIDLDKTICNEIDEDIHNKVYNGAITCSDSSKQRIVVIFYPQKDELQEVEVYDHEKRHCEDDILQGCKVEDGEAAAYLAGYLGRIFYQFRLKS